MRRLVVLASSSRCPSTTPSPSTPPRKATTTPPVVVGRTSLWLQRQDMRQRLITCVRFHHPAPHHRTYMYVDTNQRSNQRSNRRPRSGERLPKKTPRQNRNASATNHAASTRLGPQQPWHLSVQSLFPKARHGVRGKISSRHRGSIFTKWSEWWSHLGGQAHCQLAISPLSPHRPVPATATGPPMSSG